MFLNNPQRVNIEPQRQFFPVISSTDAKLITVTSDAFIEILESRPERGKLLIWNKGTQDVLISHHDYAATTQEANEAGSFILMAGGFYSDNYPAFQGTYYAKAIDGISVLSIRDFDTSVTTYN